MASDATAPILTATKAPYTTHTPNTSGLARGDSSTIEVYMQCPTNDPHHLDSNIQLIHNMKVAE